MVSLYSVIRDKQIMTVELLAECTDAMSVHISDRRQQRLRCNI